MPIQAFASVNIDDSKYMKELTIATVRDSAAMKQVRAHSPISCTSLLMAPRSIQISYLTMVFLPANFMSVSGNVLTCLCAFSCDSHRTYSA